MTGVFYYICDTCGSIADIGDRHSADEPLWACGDCGSTSLWEFSDKDNATLQARRIQDKRHAANMAKLDQAKARLDEMQSQS